jgi:hypothetical protein
VDDEFEPVLDWENQGYRWVEYGEWPSPLHFGVVSILKDSQSVSTILKYVEKFVDDQS